LQTLAVFKSGNYRLSHWDAISQAENSGREHAMPSSLRPVRTFDEAVAVLGGTNKAAEAIGKQPPAISQWRARYNQFPAKWFFVVQRALEREGRSAPVKLFTFVMR